MAPLQPSAGRDIVFRCGTCDGALIVDAAAAGMTLNCQHCGQSTTVPLAQASARMAEIQRELRENESQRTEVTGYINQLCIQIHRWKLRLQTLNERKSELEAELAVGKK
ncbi:MAG: hypothetical protein JO354_09195 [Verrucomicrobia bacterium]|nr:hypothetical protein [Verrucomicrobiota bacterium]